MHRLLGGARTSSAPGDLNNVPSTGKSNVCEMLLP